MIDVHHAFNDAVSMPLDSGDAKGHASRAQRSDVRRIVVHTPSVVRTYIHDIVAALRQRGHLVRVEPSASTSVPDTADWLLYFERLAYRAKAGRFAPALADSQAAFIGPGDLAIDLAGSEAELGQTLRLEFRDGGAGEIGLVSALLLSASPSLDVVLTERGGTPRVVVSACLAVEQPHTLATALEGTLPRLTTLIVSAVERLHNGTPVSLPPKVAAGPTQAVSFATRSLASRLLSRVARLVKRPDCWHLAVRRISGDGVLERRDWSGPSWNVVPDDGRRYFADPFLFSWDGQRWLFCEEFPKATGKGILSVASVSVDGIVGPPRPILEEPGHLSWPQVFAHRGQVYMVPESVAAGCIQLFRAVEFPHRWTLERVLVADIRAHDPVLHYSDRGAFMLATLDGDGGSSWDALGLFHAPDLLGTWQAHPQNPLWVDASAARAAGPLISHAGGLWRAAQDCRAGYGAGLALCRVTQLDETGFRQDVVARLGPPPLTGAHGVHTLSRDGDIEAIDLRGVEVRRRA